MAEALRGLDAQEAAARLKRDGFNELEAPVRRTVWRIVWEVLREPMLQLLIAAGVVYVVLGDRTEALMLLSFVAITASITVLQERRAERVLESLRDLSSPRALVIRDAVGTESLIPNSSVIKGVLQNHTLSNDDFRVSFLLKIADVADYPRARELILQSLKTSPRVLVDPPGNVLITVVAASEVTLETSFWINDLHNGHKGLISDLMFDICMRFRSEGVLLAYEGAEPLAPAKVLAPKAVTT
jgi:hypothetical protein